MPNPEVNIIKAPFAYEKKFDARQHRFIYIRKVSEQIPDDIIATGNVQRLMEFYEANKETLSLADLRYIQARLHTAMKLERMEMEAKDAIKRGELPQKAEVVQKDGYIGLETIKLDEHQTTGCGCWSCGMQLLLKSRGIDLKQEEIRAFRPDFAQGQEQQMSLGRRRMMDSDSTNYVYDQGDLIHKVLPNSAVTNVLIKPLPDQFVLEGGPQAPVHPMAEQGFFQLPAAEQQRRQLEWQQADAKYKEDVRKIYNRQVRKQMVEMVRKALVDDRSPVVMNAGGGHFVTITGISEDGAKFRVEDSIGSKESCTTYLPIDDLVRRSLGSNSKGITLAWLKDLPTPEYVPENQEAAQGEAPVDRKEKMQENVMRAEVATGTHLFEPNLLAVDIEEDGSLSIKDVPDTNIIASSQAKPDLGQLKGQNISDSLKLDQTDMKQALGGGTLKNDVVHLDRPEAEIFLGDQQYYYPKKLCLKNDPALEKGQQYEQLLAKQEELERDMQARIQKMHIEKVMPGAGTLGAEMYEQQQQLFLHVDDTVMCLARIYALNAVMSGTLRMSDEERAEQVITPDKRAQIDLLTQKACPMIETLLEKSEGKADMVRMACSNDVKPLLTIMDNYVQTRKLGANKDAAERTSVLGSALQTLLDDGTGRNKLGIRRKENSAEFQLMMKSLTDYTQNPAPDAFDHHDLTQKCLNYIQGKYKVRGSETGRMRFDTTMRILAQVMPENEFRGLCNKINHARKLDGKPLDEDYVHPGLYAPKTVHRIVEDKISEWKTKANYDPAKELSEILAARQIAMQRNPQRGLKTEIIRLNNEEDDRSLLQETAKQIRQSKVFKDVMKTFAPGAEARLQQMMEYAADGGAKLVQTLNNLHLPRPQAQQPTQPKKTEPTGPQPGPK